MNIDAINTRFTVIERDWKDASGDARNGFLAELATMTGELATASGPQADSARWLTRRISRVARLIDSETQATP